MNDTENASVDGSGVEGYGGSVENPELKQLTSKNLQKYQTTTREQTALWSLSNHINLRNTMKTERLSGLALMNINYEKPVNYDAMVQLFAGKYPRKVLLADPGFQWNTKLKNNVKCSIISQRF